MRLQPRTFLLRLALCRGLSCSSKLRVWQSAEADYDFEHLERIANSASLTMRGRDALLNNWPSPELDQAVTLNSRLSYITILDSAYPSLLKEIACPPLVLWYKGDIKLLSRQLLAIVGARQMSSYSMSVLRGILPSVITSGVTTISGLARGVDGLSHELTLQYGGQTVAVVGCGLDRCYPRQNQALFDTICQHGLIVSEYPLASPPLPFHFPERNRIIAGLCQTLLVTEARHKSGSLITANLALEDNRNVCAIPGRIDAPLSVGCNELIADGATPICNSRDLLAELKTTF